MKRKEKEKEAKILKAAAKKAQKAGFKIVSVKVK